MARKPGAEEKVPSAAKRKALQERLNKNKELREEFLENPGAVLRAEGVEISAPPEKADCEVSRRGHGATLADRVAALKPGSAAAH